MKEFEANMPNYFDNEAYNRIYQEMIKQEVSIITFAEAKAQISRMNSRKETDKPIFDFPAYFVGGIKINRKSVKTALKSEKFRKAETEPAGQPEKANNNQEPLPFYNWLDS